MQHKNRQTQWILGLLAVLSCPLPAMAAASRTDRWNVTVWQPNDASPNTLIAGVAQTKDGYLWVGSSSGLARFDGVKFDQFPLSTLAGGGVSKIGAIARSRDGSLIVVLWPGQCVQLNFGGAARVVAGLPETRPTSVLEDNEGTIWVSYYAGSVWRIDRNNNKATQVTEADGLPSGKDICLLKEDINGHVWFSKAKQVGVFRNGRFETVKSFPAFAEIAPAREGGVWVSSSFSLYRCTENGGTEKRGSYKPEHSTGRALVLFEDHSGAVWIGTSDNGLFRYHQSSFESIPTSHHRINSVTEDNEGNLWVGTGGGLNRVRPRIIALKGTATGLVADMVMSICEDDEGVLWTASQDGLLRCDRGEGWTAPRFEELTAQDTVACVATAPGGALWIGTRGGRLVEHLQSGKGTAYSPSSGLAGHSISKLLAASNGDIWIAEQSPDVLERLRSGQLQQFSLPGGPDHIRAMVEDSGRDVWIASENGKFWRIHGDEVTDETDRLPAGSGRILCLYIGPDGSIWIGTQWSGVARFKDGKGALIGTEAGLFDKSIAQIVADGHGWIWFGSSKGIFKVREQELTDVAEGRASRVRSMFYGEEEGLPTLHGTVARSNGLKARDGRVWMIMGTALVTIDPDQVSEQGQPPPVVLESVAVDGEQVAAYGGVIPLPKAIDSVAPAEALRLSSDYHKLRFDFTALSFNAPTNVQFQYQLVGYDNSWNDAGSQRHAIYSRLPPGDYRFVVRACNSDGIWNEGGSSLSFTIVPSLWQSWWFRAGAAIGATVLVLLMARYLWFRRLRQKLAALEQRAALDRERARIARDIHDDLGCGLTKIVLLSELSMQELNGSPQTASVRQIATTAKQQMKSLDETVWAINPRNDTLADLIDYIGSFAVESLRDAGVKCQVDLPEEPPDVPVPSEARHSLFLAVKEALNNILRHSQASDVAIIVSVENGSLSIVIADNGRGFSPAPAQLGQDGLQNMEQRLQEIGGTFQLNSTPGSGTRISLVYPLPAPVATP